MIILRSYPRLHIGLLDLGAATQRKYGGGGFSIDACPIVIHAVPASQLTLHGINELDHTAQLNVWDAINRFYAAVPCCPLDITLVSIPPQHIGLGTKTALILGILQALNCAADSRLDETALQRLSGRGGTSGVGIHTFFTGGFIADLGHRIDHEPKSYAPSSAERSREVPPVCCHTNIPEHWNFHLILAEGHRLSGIQELKFFKESTPLVKEEVFESIATMYHGVVPAVIDGKIGSLSASLNRFHEIGFKGKELSAQSESVRNTYNIVRGIPDCAVGLSSLGPLLYVVTDEKDTDCDSQITSLCKSSVGLRHLTLAKGRNKGFEVTKNG